MAQMPARPQVAKAAQRGPGRHRRVQHYPGIGLQVAFDGADAVAQAIAQAVRGWTPEIVQDTQPQGRTSTVVGTGAGYVTQSVYLDTPLHGLGVASAACAVIADLAEDYFDSRAGCLALHCAAFRYNSRLIAMTGPSRAGKSTLAARLTLEADMQVFCDDVLPLLADGAAVALGIAPRLRLPLPEACSPAFKAHVARHMGPSDARYGYLCAPTVAPHGTRAPLSVLLILDRRWQTPARLHEVAEDEALHFLLSQNMSDLRTAEAGFARLSGLLAGVTCLRLVYSDLEDAVALIRRAFGDAAPIADGITIGPVLRDVATQPLPQAKQSPDISWSRLPDVVIQRKADSAFLWQPGQQRIWHMNRLGLAVWTLLEIPGTAQEIGGLLHEQFPDEDEGSLIRDVNALLQALADDGLIVQAGPEHPDQQI
jgi:hypothetical protein